MKQERRQPPFETREAELEQAISEAETDEEKQAVEEEVEKFETEKKEHDEEVSKLENDVAAKQKDLADTEAEQPKPAAKPEERGERKTMTTRKNSMEWICRKETGSSPMMELRISLAKSDHVSRKREH